MDQLLEYFGVLTGILYLLLEIKQHRAMWIIGILTSLFYIFIFFNAKIYADMGLNIYYVCISIYGFWHWKENRDKLKETTQPENSRKDMILYSHITPLLFIKVCFSIACIFLILYYILHYFTDSPIPVGDAFTTAVGIVATWMLAKQIIEHWFFWIIVNVVSIYLYYIRGLYPTMFLYICYGVLAIVGLYTWKKKGFKTDDTTL